MRESDKQLEFLIGPQLEQAYVDVAQKYDLDTNDALTHEASAYYYFGNDAKFIAQALLSSRETNLGYERDKTGVLSESAFRQRFNTVIQENEHSRRHGEHNGTLLITFDALNFKSINEAYGQSGGDEVLKLIADFLKTVARTNNGDFVGRFGGDEFAMVLRYDKSIISEEEFLGIIEQRLLNCPIKDMPNFNGLRWNHAFHKSGLSDETLYRLADVKGKNKEDGLVRDHSQTPQEYRAAYERALFRSLDPSLV